MRSPILSRIFSVGFIFLILLGSPFLRAEQDGERVGVFYFPGWRDNTPYSPAKFPWDRIKEYPERKPLLGWYDEGRAEVLDSHLKWMSEYGVSFVVFDWYFGKNRKVNLSHVLDAYLVAKDRHGVGFTIMWANHDTLPESVGDWKSMVDVWLDSYLSDPDYLRVGGAPVVFVFSARLFEKQAEQTGSTVKELIALAKGWAKEKGFKGLHFVVGSEAVQPLIGSSSAVTGYSAFFTYNWHRGPRDARVSHSFAELDDGYRRQWSLFLSDSLLPLVVPMTVGWDRRPWGGSSDSLHDESMASPAEFRAHLDAGAFFMKKMRSKYVAGDGAEFAKLAVVCCWNEFGEGAFLEPSKAWGFQYLDAIRSVFGKGR